ncbi:MAG: GlxA family transcriptional regulator [Burkholderiaceae bacterium]|nr:GlxA family transcriptional regulator [Burkholderiaceae bacterium]
MTRTIAIAIHEGVQALDVAGPIDVFAEANHFLEPDAQYETILVAEHRNPLRTSSGMLLIADRSFAEAECPFDIVLVAGGPDVPEFPPTSLIQWLATAHAQAGIYGSICTGAFVLGHAGLLDDRRATTHWQNAQQLACEFPKARVEPDSIYVRDGRLITSAGVTAGIDLALALVREHHGAQIALTVAKRLVVVAQRQGGQSQFSPYLSTPTDPASPVARLQQYVMANISERHTLQSLANVVGMSTRNLTRHFVQETEITPHEFVLRARIDAARMVLESTDQPLKTVAFKCGFGNADRMRLVFKERLRVTPAKYRASFQRPEPTDRKPAKSVVP